MDKMGRPSTVDENVCRKSVYVIMCIVVKGCHYYDTVG